MKKHDIKDSSESILMQLREDILAIRNDLKTCINSIHGIKKLEHKESYVKLTDEIGQRIKDLRKSQKMSMARLGKSADVTAPTIFQIEHAHYKTVHKTVLLKLAVALSTTVEWLIGE